VASVAAADPVISKVDIIPDYQNNFAMSLEITLPGAPVTPSMVVVPLTAAIGLNGSDTVRQVCSARRLLLSNHTVCADQLIQSITVRGPLVVADEDTYVNFKNPNDIALLCCDDLNSSFINASIMLKTLMTNKPKGILLYSQQGMGCGLEATAEDLTYVTIFSMTSTADAESALNFTAANTGATEGVVAQASITGNFSGPTVDGAESQQGNNSAVAMSILYSITGLITLLFLVIIATGAIRAHRYPERYGPRSAYGGRPRQSRARGIARAVLETIPIVKFGAAPAAKPDPNIELEDTELGQRNVHHLSTIPEDAESQPKSTNQPERESRMPVAAATVAAAAGEGERLGDEHLGCSICTEDFTVGEDVRVLPCDHKFHPPCIDPWLINVSGTCPLW
jgi:hypothetical protein